MKCMIWEDAILQAVDELKDVRPEYNNAYLALFIRAGQLTTITTTREDDVKAAREFEREACAQLVEKMTEFANEGCDIAAEIRARGKS
jgi:hypothetical protein